MFGWKWSFVFLFIVLIESQSFAASPRRTKVGLALSGGGARGISHIGVLKVLEEYRVPIDAVAGTSMGAIVGALYASGYSVKEIETIFEKTNWFEVLFTDFASRRAYPFYRKFEHERYLFDFELGFKNGKPILPPALSRAYRLNLLFQSYFLAENEDFSQLPVPFRAVATDLETGKMVVLDRGSLADAIRASSAFPGVLPPVEIDGKLLLDGGSTNNLPVDQAKLMGADRVIAVDVSSPVFGREGLQTFFDIADQAVNILVRRTTKDMIDKADILIVPELKDETMFSSKTVAGLIELGEQKTRMEEKRLKKLSLSEVDYLAYQEKRLRKNPVPIRIDSIEIEGLKRVDPRIVRSQIRTKENSDLDSKIISADLTRIYSLGDFEKVDYSLKRKDGKNVLHFRLREKSWGPNFLRFGFTWDGEIKGQQDFNLLVNLQFTRLNTLGARWNWDFEMGTNLVLNTEIYQPLDFSGLTFFAPHFTASRTDQDAYLIRDRIAEYENDFVGGGADLGLSLNDFELRFGISRGLLLTELQLGVNAAPELHAPTAALVTQAKLDTLDDAYLPRRGLYASAFFYDSYKNLGAENSYRKLFGQFVGFISIERFTFFGGALAGARIGDRVLPAYDRFLLGGIHSFSGFREGELQGDYFGSGRIGSLWRLPVPQILLWDNVYLGIWGEAGNVWDTKKDVDLGDLKYTGTAALGFDTKLGSVFLAYGQSGVNNRQFYVSVGRTFGFRNPRIY